MTAEGSQVGELRDGVPVDTLVGVVLLLGGLGAALRFYDLGLDALTTSEAATAWSASQISRGLEPMSLASPPTSALLLSAQVMLFWFFESSAVLARMVPAFAGTAAIVLVPLGLRGLLGGPGTLALAGLLAFDPGWVLASRSADGDILSALSFALVMVWAAHSLSGRAWFSAHKRNIYGALLLAGLVASGVSAWDYVVALIVFVVCRAVACRGVAVGPNNEIDSLVRWCSIFLLVITTTGLVQWVGPGVVSSSLTSWLAGWRDGFTWSEWSLTPSQWLIVLLAPWSLWRLKTPVTLGVLASAVDEVAPPRLVLALWLAWGVVVFTRSSAHPWLLLSMPIFLLAALGVNGIYRWLSQDVVRTSRTSAQRLLVTRLAVAALAIAFLVINLLAALRALPHRELSAVDLLRRDLVRWVDEVPSPGLVRFDWQDWPEPRVGWACRGFEARPTPQERSHVPSGWSVSVRGSAASLIERRQDGPAREVRTFSYLLPAATD